MPNKTIYVKDGDLWERAKKIAGKDGLSSAISEALTEYVTRKEKDALGIKRYRLEVGYEGAGPETDDGGGMRARAGSTGRIAFDGQLLVQQALPVPLQIELNGMAWTEEIKEIFEEMKEIFTVYRTKSGKLILTASSPQLGGTTHYAVYTTITQLREDPYLLKNVAAPDRAPFLDMVAEKAGEDWAVWIE